MAGFIAIGNQPTYRHPHAVDRPCHPPPPPPPYPHHRHHHHCRPQYRSSPSSSPSPVSSVARVARTSATCRYHELHSSSPRAEQPASPRCTGCSSRPARLPAAMVSPPPAPPVVAANEAVASRAPRSVDWRELDKRRFVAYGSAMLVAVRAMVFPATQVKTRLQVYGRDAYRDGRDAVVKIARREGVRGFYRGPPPRPAASTPGPLVFLTLPPLRDRCRLRNRRSRRDAGADDLPVGIRGPACASPAPLAGHRGGHDRAAARLRIGPYCRRRCGSPCPDRPCADRRYLAAVQRPWAVGRASAHPPYPDREPVASDAARIALHERTLAPGPRVGAADRGRGGGRAPGSWCICPPAAPARRDRTWPRPRAVSRHSGKYWPRTGSAACTAAL